MAWREEFTPVFSDIIKKFLEGTAANLLIIQLYEELRNAVLNDLDFKGLKSVGTNLSSIMNQHAKALDVDKTVVFKIDKFHKMRNRSAHQEVGTEIPREQVREFISLVVNILKIMPYQNAPNETINELIRNWEDVDREYIKQHVKPQSSANESTRVVKAAGKVQGNDLAHAFLGKDIDAGHEALQKYMERGENAVAEAIELLKDVFGTWRSYAWSETHRTLVLYRFKKFFSYVQKASAAALVEVVREGKFEAGGYAAQCFDLFIDDSLKVQTAYRITSTFKDLSSEDLLANPDPVLNGITAIGYLGQDVRGYGIASILERIPAELGEKFRNSVLSACARAIVKAPSQPSQELYMSLWYFTRFLDGFISGRFCSGPQIPDDWDINGIKEILRQRTRAEQSDLFLHGLKDNRFSEASLPGTKSSGADNPVADQIARECYAHVLGTLGLPRFVPTLKKILLDAREPLTIRMECALALGRIRHRQSATALRQAAEILAARQYASPDYSTLPRLTQQELMDSLFVITEQAIGRLESGDQPQERDGLLYTLFSLSQVAHLGVDPAGDLQYVFDAMQSHRGPLFARAIGLCKAGQYTALLEEWLSHSNDEMRGQAGLALARIYGTEHLEQLQEHMDQASSYLEHLLFSLALLEAGADPGPDLVRSCLQEVLFNSSGIEGPEAVVEDTFLILDKSNKEYKQLIMPWKEIKQTTPPCLNYTFLPRTTLLDLINNY